MDLIQAIEARHSVRSFTDKKIEDKTEAVLRKEINDCNKESGLHIQLCLNEPEAFQAAKPHYGSFQNCSDYIAIVTTPGKDELCGYYGEKIVLLAQTLGLNTCWVAQTYKKRKATYVCNEGEKLRIVIALGYGKTQGVQHKSKEISRLCEVSGDMPDWFSAGLKAAALAPTAVNQQKFLFALNGRTVSAKPLSSIFGNTKIDLGIVRCHFEIGAGDSNFQWAK